MHSTAYNLKILLILGHVPFNNNGPKNLSLSVTVMHHKTKLRNFEVEHSVQWFWMLLHSITMFHDASMNYNYPYFFHCFPFLQSSTSQNLLSLSAITSANTCHRVVSFNYLIFTPATYFFCLHFHTDLKLTLWLYKSNWCLSTHYSQAITFTILLRYLRHFSSITSNQAFGTCYPYHPTSKSSIYSFPFKPRVCYYYYCCTIELW